jgi:hypothetical protein
MLNVAREHTTHYYAIDNVTVNKENHDVFELRSSNNPEILLSVKYPLKKRDVNFENYQCIPFSSPYYFKESNIFQVHVSQNHVGRIGWIFPIQSLLSNEHSFAENEYFLNYAGAAFLKLLNGELFQNDIFFEVGDFNEELNISNFYPTSLIVLVISTLKTSEIIGFNIENYFPSLFKYKYFYCESVNDLSKTLPVSEGVESAIFSNLNIVEMSSFLNDDIYIKSLFKNHLKIKNHPLVQFHLLYQIIELLIGKVYECEVKQLIAIASERSKSSHELLDEIRDLPKEDTRIKLLFSSYLSKQLTNSSSFLNSLSDLLKKFQLIKEDLPSALYKVRNLLVHDFRTVTNVDSDYMILEDININFEKIIIEVLNCYQESVDYNSPLQWIVYKASI